MRVMAMARRSPGWRWRRGLSVAALVLSLVGLALAQEGERGGGEPAPLVLVTDIDGPIGPPVTRQIGDLIEAGEARGAELVVLRMDTPGGLTTSTREINKAILAAEVPVAVFVAPAGSRAASAGTYILYASHVAAMAPGTNVGAATPVQMGGGGAPGLPGGDPTEGPGESPGEGGDPARDGAGGDAGSEGSDGAPAEPPGDSLTEKAINDAVAQIRSLAELRGRNADWAEKAVREAASLSARRALEKDVIEHVAADLPALLAAIDGRTVEIGDGTRTLSTADATVEVVEPSLVTELLGILANPNVALLLMTLGFYGIVFELSSPGLGPGIFGAICLLLGLYALNLLPIDYAGLALVGLGLALMAAEAVTPSFGILGLGGAVSFVMGAAILVDTDAPQYQIAWPVIGTLAGVSLLFSLVVVGAIWRTGRGRARTGAEAMAGSAGQVMDWHGRAGHVWTHGERWSAVGPDGLEAGDAVEVADMEGLTLTVRRAVKLRKSQSERDLA